MLPQRNSCTLRFQVPARGFNCRLRHAVPAYSFHQIVNCAFIVCRLTDDHRPQKVFQRGPASFSPFFRIKRSLAPGTLAPTIRAVTIDNPHEHNPSLSCASTTGLEEM